MSEMQSRQERTWSRSCMMDDKGRRVKEAGPSQPVEILGLNDVPNAGEVFVGCDSERMQEVLQRRLSLRIK